MMWPSLFSMPKNGTSAYQALTRALGKAAHNPHSALHQLSHSFAVAFL